MRQGHAREPGNELSELCSLAVGLYIFIRCVLGGMFLKVDIDCSISACQHPNSDSVKPTGQLFSHFFEKL